MHLFDLTTTDKKGKCKMMNLTKRKQVERPANWQGRRVVVCIGGVDMIRPPVKYRNVVTRFFGEWWGDILNGKGW